MKEGVLGHMGRGLHRYQVLSQCAVKYVGDWAALSGMTLLARSTVTFCIDSQTMEKKEKEKKSCVILGWLIL